MNQPHAKMMGGLPPGALQFDTAAALDSHIATLCCDACANLLDASFKAAVLRGHSASSDHGNSKCLGRTRMVFCGYILSGFGRPTQGDAGLIGAFP